MICGRRVKLERHTSGCGECTDRGDVHMSVGEFQPGHDFHHKSCFASIVRVTLNLDSLVIQSPFTTSHTPEKSKCSKGLVVAPPPYLWFQSCRSPEITSLQLQQFTRYICCDIEQVKRDRHTHVLTPSAKPAIVPLSDGHLRAHGTGRDIATYLRVAFSFTSRSSAQTRSRPPTHAARHNLAYSSAVPVYLFFQSLQNSR